MAPFQAEVHPCGMFGVKQELPVLPGLGMGQDPPGRVAHSGAGRAIHGGWGLAGLNRGWFGDWLWGWGDPAPSKGRPGLLLHRLQCVDSTPAKNDSPKTSTVLRVRTCWSWGLGRA